MAIDPRTHQEICSIGSCGKVLDANDLEELHTIGGKVVCSDCYFDAVGKLVEEHPIHTPGRHGPGGQANLD